MALHTLDPRIPTTAMRLHLPFVTVLTALLLHGCSSVVPDYQQRLIAVLPDQRDVEFNDSRMYPGEVLCGSYTSFNGGSFTSITRRYIVNADRVLPNPDDREVTVFCSEDAVKAVESVLGVNLNGDPDVYLTLVRDMGVLEHAISSYYERLQVIPPTLASLLDDDAAGNPRITDPWGNPYHYVRGLSGRVGPRYELYSLGADARTGGSGENADVQREDLPLIAHALALRE